MFKPTHESTPHVIEVDYAKITDKLRRLIIGTFDCYELSETWIMQWRKVDKSLTKHARAQGVITKKQRLKAYIADDRMFARILN